MSSEKESVVSACKSCGPRINHDEIHSHHESGDDSYHCSTYYRIIRCKGCGAVSFLYEFLDFEQAYHNSEGEFEYDTKIENYPRFIQGHKEIDGIWFVPNIVSEIYTQSLIAIRESASILAGIGLRSTIEAICNERKIPGRNLEIRISKLAASGLISKKDADRLHAIRFMGNDAAHDIKGATSNQLNVALKIVEHLMQTIYVLEKEADGSLDTTISSFDEFEKILNDHVADIKEISDVTLGSILGKDARRIYACFGALETELIGKIKSGEYNGLELGKTEAIGKPPKDMQFYTISAKSIEAAESGRRALGPRPPRAF
ncbi:MAG: hypothetical protein JWO51_2944 [Rhodospirillales bacterium]|nr:hypothetical protein [Rhodospirillales bacterium]